MNGRPFTAEGVLGVDVSRETTSGVSREWTPSTLARKARSAGRSHLMDLQSSMLL